MLGLQRLPKISSLLHVQPKFMVVRRNFVGGKEDSLESTLEELGRLLRNTTTEPEEEFTPPPVKKEKKKSLEPKKMQIEDLKYLHMYPKLVQRLVLNAKSPYGYFNDNGNWIESDRSSKRIETDKEHDFTDAQLNVVSKPTHPKMEGCYRFGITEEEIKDCHPKIKEFFSLAYAPAQEVLAYKVKKLTEQYGKHEFDTGNVAVQIAVISEKISHINSHLVLHHHDNVAKRSLTRLLVQRRAYMKYLKKKNVSVYYPLLKDLGLKDSYTL